MQYVQNVVMWPSIAILDLQFAVAGSYSSLIPVAAGLGAAYYLYGVPSLDAGVMELGKQYLVAGAALNLTAIATGMY